MFSTSAVGFVVLPEAMESMIRCSYPGDGNSMNINGGCGNGGCCPPHWGNDGLADMMWKHEAERKGKWCVGSCACAFGASHKDRYHCMYNEVYIPTLGIKPRTGRWGSVLTSSSVFLSPRLSLFSPVSSPSLGSSPTMWEVVLDGNKWQRFLPSLIEAIFYPINGHVDSSEGDRNEATDVRRRLIDAYGGSTAPPLLSYDIGEATAGRNPFREDDYRDD